MADNPKTKTLGPIKDARGIPGWKVYRKSAEALALARQNSEDAKGKIRSALTGSAAIKKKIKDLDLKDGAVDFLWVTGTNRINVFWSYGKADDDADDLSADFKYDGPDEEDTNGADEEDIEPAFKDPYNEMIDRGFNPTDAKQLVAIQKKIDANKATPADLDKATAIRGKYGF